MQRKGLEDMKQVNRSLCRGCSCDSCWQASLESCCFRCSKEAVEEVEDISPRYCYGRRKVILPLKDALEIVEPQPKKTGWCSSCSPCCQNRKKRKRELACYEPEQINLDDLDPTLVFQKKKELDDHDQVAYRRGDDLTVLDYLEAGWPVQEEAQKSSKCFLCFCCKKKKLDSKEKGKATSSCCSSPCGGKKKGVDLDNFKKIDNSLALASTKQKGKLSCCKSPCGDRSKGVEVQDVENIGKLIAIAGASSGTLVWDKPPPITQQDLAKESKDQPEATVIKKTSQIIHNNVLFDQGSTITTPPAGLPAKSPSGGGPIPPPPPPPVVRGAQTTGQLPQGWSWLMDNSSSANTPTNVAKKPDVQTRFVHIIPEIVDSRFELKGNDDVDVSEKKEKNSPRKLKFKDRDDNVETSLVQFAKPEIVDRRFQLKSKDDAFQKKEEKFQIIEEDVERLGVLHNKLGILQQQLLQREQILVLEDKLKEQGHLQRRKEELALEKEQLEILREKTRGREPLERTNDETSLEKEHLALLREVMNEKEQLERSREEFNLEKKRLEMVREEQLERKKEEILMEKKHLELLREEQLERKKAELALEKKHLEMLREKLSQKEHEDLSVEKHQIEVLQRQFSLEAKERFQMREQEIAIEKEKVETLREKLSAKEKVQLELKKEELSLQLEKTKEELVREKQHFQAMKETLDSEEKVQIEKSKVQLALERKQLEELREKLKHKEKDEIKKKKEMLDDVMMQLETLSKNLTSKEMLLLEKKEALSSREKDPFEFLLQENEKVWKKKDDSHLSDFVTKSAPDSHEYKGGHKLKGDKHNPKLILPLATVKEKTSWKNNGSREVEKGGWDCQSSSYKKMESLDCIGGFIESSSIANNCGLPFKTTWPPRAEIPQTAEELFDIENRRQGGILELTTSEKKGQHRAVDKRHKGKQHMEHDHSGTQELIDCFKKVKEGARKRLDTKVYPAGADDDKKRPRGSHDYDGHDTFHRPLDVGGQLPKGSGLLRDHDGEHKKKVDTTLRSDDLTSQHGNKSDQTRFQNSCANAKQLLSYNFDPPKKRSETEPLKKKAKKSDNICGILPTTIPPSCGGTRLDFPGRLMLSSCNIKQIKAPEFFNHRHRKHEVVLEHPKKDSKSTEDKERPSVKQLKSKFEPEIEKPRVKARFRFRGLLDEKAQHKLLGKLKELELQDLKAKLADKQKLLEKFENPETSASRNPKSP